MSKQSRPSDDEARRRAANRANRARQANSRPGGTRSGSGPAARPERPGRTESSLLGRLTSGEHAYALILALIVGSPAWPHQRWWLSVAELVVLAAVTEGVLIASGGLAHNTNDDPHYPITPRQVVVFLATLAVAILLGGLFFNMASR
ncbi:hypothetical protein [Actinomyces haliotis]|uniref:hypothetical protein n=1 Tax=Actinomyces haliotis TaxID=1280843 RepID=UPI00188DEFD2|nr:hypothetical protein [Actinomyces haliotis]